MKFFPRYWCRLRVMLGLAFFLSMTATGNAGNHFDADASQSFRSGCAGVWIGNIFGPDGAGTELVAVENITPLDAFGLRMLYRLEPANPLGPFGPQLFQKATVVADGHGVMIRRGRNRYEGRWIGYVAEPPDLDAFTRGEVQWFFIVEMTMECDDDMLTQSGSLHLYSAIDDPDAAFPDLGIMGVQDQDRNQDGFPDKGELPLATLPFEKTSQRFE